MIVSFNNADRTFKFKNKTALKAFIKKMFHEEHKESERISYIFCSNDYLLALNREYLGHDYNTDIITFDLSNDHKTIGEIYISLDQVELNSQALGTDLKDETLRVIFHGVLHLCGYKDKKKSHLKEMRSKEDFYLSGFSDYLKTVSRETKSEKK